MPCGKRLSFVAGKRFLIDRSARSIESYENAEATHVERAL
jgi:hypothetical protein